MSNLIITTTTTPFFNGRKGTIFPTDNNGDGMVAAVRFQPSPYRGFPQDAILVLSDGRELRATQPWATFVQSAVGAEIRKRLAILGEIPSRVENTQEIRMINNKLRSLSTIAEMLELPGDILARAGEGAALARALGVPHGTVDRSNDD